MAPRQLRTKTSLSWYRFPAPGEPPRRARASSPGLSGLFKPQPIKELLSRPTGCHGQDSASKHLSSQREERVVPPWVYSNCGTAVGGIFEERSRSGCRSRRSVRRTEDSLGWLLEDSPARRTEKVIVVARRGPYEAKFDEKELGHVEAHLDRGEFIQELERVKARCVACDQDVSVEKIGDATFPGCGRTITSRPRRS